MSEALFELDAIPDKSQRSVAGVGSGRAQSHDWITPKFIIDALGPFDLDVCESPTQPWPCAKFGYVLPMDGLNEKWNGRVWCNPPYSVHAAAWLAKMRRHGQGTALIFARTETEMFFEHVWGGASALLFLEGRLHFHYPDGVRADANCGGPSVLIAYGERDAQKLEQSGLSGALGRTVRLMRSEPTTPLLFPCINSGGGPAI